MREFEVIRNKTGLTTASFIYIFSTLCPSIFGLLIKKTSEMACTKPAANAVQTKPVEVSQELQDGEKFVKWDEVGGCSVL